MPRYQVSIGRIIREPSSTLSMAEPHARIADQRPPVTTQASYSCSSVTKSARRSWMYCIFVTSTWRSKALRAARRLLRRAWSSSSSRSGSSGDRHATRNAGVKSRSYSGRDHGRASVCAHSVYRCVRRASRPASPRAPWIRRAATTLVMRSRRASVVPCCLIDAQDLMHERQYRQHDAARENHHLESQALELIDRQERVISHARRNYTGVAAVYFTDHTVDFFKASHGLDKQHVRSSFSIGMTAP